MWLRSACELCYCVFCLLLISVLLCVGVTGCVHTYVRTYIQCNTIQYNLTGSLPEIKFNERDLAGETIKGYLPVPNYTRAHAEQELKSTRILAGLAPSTVSPIPQAMPVHS